MRADLRKRAFSECVFAAVPHASARGNSLLHSFLTPFSDQSHFLIK